MIRREFLIFGEKRNLSYKSVISEGCRVKGKRHEVRADILDRIYRIFWIFFVSQFPEEIEKKQSALRQR
jgi:hypothetical protein